MRGGSACKACGFSEVHLNSIRWAKETSALTAFYGIDPQLCVSERDRFGNTPLHFAAANGKSGILHLVKCLIEEDLNLGMRNSSGETFMHVMNPAQFNAINEIIELLQLLAKRDFPFLHRDNHDQSTSDVFFMAVNPNKFSYEHLAIIVSHLQPHPYDLSCLAQNFERRQPFAGNQSPSEALTDGGLPSKNSWMS